MQSLEPLDQLAVEAFATALETCREEGIELPEEVWTIAQSLEHHVAELSEIAKQHPQLNAAYRTARKLLRQAEGDRKKRMGTDDQVFSSQFSLSPEQSISPPLFPWEKEVEASLASGHSSSDHSSKAADPTIRTDPAAASPAFPIQPIIYRYTLPDTASPQAAIAFSEQVEAIRQSNPDWVVSFDRPSPGEANAIVLIHKDELYATIHAAYLMNQTLNQVVGPALARIFGSTPFQISKSS